MPFVDPERLSFVVEDTMQAVRKKYLRNVHMHNWFE